MKALEITEQYVLLATEAMLKVAPRFMTTLAILLAGNVRGQVRGKIVRIAELLLQQAHGIGGAEGVQVVVGILIESKFLPQIISGLKSAHDAHQTTGPNRTHTDIEGIIESDYFGLVARILYSSPNTFVDAVAASAGPFEKAIDWLLTEWFSDFQDMGNSARKKLMCLALSKLFELGPDKKLQDRLQDYVDMWTDVVMECIDYEQDDDGEPIGEGRDCLVYDDISRLKWGDAPDAPEDERRRKVSRPLRRGSRNKLTSTVAVLRSSPPRERQGIRSLLRPAARGGLWRPWRLSERVARQCGRRRCQGFRQPEGGLRLNRPDLSLGAFAQA